MNKKDLEYEVIISDDGSRDNTIKESEKARSLLNNLHILPSEKNQGKGFAIKRGFLAAAGEYVMWMDADSATSIEELEKFLPYMHQQEDVLIGSRRMKGSEVLVREPLLRIILGNTYLYIAKILLGLKVSDVNCGFKVFKGQAGKLLFSKIKRNDWSLDAELLFISKKHNFSLKEIPIKWIHSQQTSKVKPLKAGIESFISILCIVKNGITGVYE